MHNQIANDVENSISLDDSQSPPSIPDGLKEEDRPVNWSSSKKWSIVVSTSLATFVVSFGSSVYSAAIPHIQARFNVSPDTALLGITLYVIGFALGPMAWGPASELYGKRRPLFLGYAIFCICQLPCALAQNMPLLLAFRFFSGLAGSSSLAILGGIKSATPAFGNLIDDLQLIFFTIYMSLAYGIIYLTFTMYPLAFVSVRGWSRMDGSLPFIGMTIGVVLACIWIALHSIYYIQQSRVHVPERRLPPMIAGSILLSAGIFWFGWTSSRYVRKAAKQAPAQPAHLTRRERLGQESLSRTAKFSRHLETSRARMAESDIFFQYEPAKLIQPIRIERYGKFTAISPWSSTNCAALEKFLLIDFLSPATLSEDLSHVPIELRFSGHVISLYIEGSGNYMGRIESKAIVDLVEDYQVTLATTLECPPVKKEKSTDSFQTPKTLHIVVYGLRKDMNEIGDILEDSELFLQHPTEYDTRLEYLNPQYLLRPGATIPKADSATFQAIAKQHSPDQVMEGKAKGEVHRVFDSASGPSTFTHILPSPRLRTSLQEHIVSDQIRVVLFHGHTRDRLAKSLMEHDVVLTTYGTLQSEWRSKKGDSPLFTQPWARVVLDEAHHIRERSTQTFRAVTALRTSRRWCLTGTPIQNRLDDYGALLSFIGVPPFIGKSVFDFWIMKPVVQGTDEGLRRLKLLVSATCLRRTKYSVSETLNLPDRKVHECVVQLDPEDRELYDFFKRNASHLIANRGFGDSNTANKTGSILPIINTLRLICNHGKRLLPKFAFESWSNRQNPNSGPNFTTSKFGLCICCGVEALPNEMQSEFACSHLLCSKCADSDERYQLTLDSVLCPSCTKDEDSAVTDAATGEGNYQPSAKIRAVIQSLRIEQQGNAPTFGNKPIKSVVFTFWRKMLNLLETALRGEGFKFARIDGQKSLLERTSALQSFRDDGRCTVMIATIGSIGEGVDLTTANFVHLVEPHWNPMLEEQALDRVHRMGQTRDVVATRYITNDSIEMLVKEIRERKLDLINGSLGHLSGLGDIQY
ncbi:hypothetical protein FPRO06_09099 [Fusarium proliferatum]|nr:hypothetical protein FPRO06_09099 [Fusarium proliferatum]